MPAFAGITSRQVGDSPRIIAGLWKGRKLAAPAGDITRPTGARARQAAFDILLHADWAGADFVRAARVLDVFAGTGAYGLEALSRGAASATFIEMNRAALAAIRANIAACKVEERTRVMAADALRPPPGHAHDLVFLDPPYGQDFVPRALLALRLQGWIAPGAVIAAELGPEDAAPVGVEVLAERVHGKARLMFWKTAM
jgi:16S rRNA (guanine966-N2)-methyltransferase